MHASPARYFSPADAESRDRAWSRLMTEPESGGSERERKPTCKAASIPPWISRQSTKPIYVIRRSLTDFEPLAQKAKGFGSGGEEERAISLFADPSDYGLRDLAPCGSAQERPYESSTLTFRPLVRKRLSSSETCSGVGKKFLETGAFTLPAPDGRRQVEIPHRPGWGIGGWMRDSLTCQLFSRRMRNLHADMKFLVCSSRPWGPAQIGWPSACQRAHPAGLARYRWTLTFSSSR